MDSHNITSATPQISPLEAPSTPVAPFRHKARAGLLAAVFGWAGAHWLYLGRRYSWAVLAFSLLAIGTALRGNPWYFHPAFFLFLIPAVAGFIEALVICLMSDAKFDAKYNPGHSRATKTGWGPVLIAIFTLAIGTTILMIGVTLFFQAIFEGIWF